MSDIKSLVERLNEFRGRPDRFTLTERNELLNEASAHIARLERERSERGIDTDAAARAFEDSKYYFAGESPVRRIEDWRVWIDAWNACRSALESRLGAQAGEPVATVVLSVDVDGDAYARAAWIGPPPAEGANLYAAPVADSAMAKDAERYHFLKRQARCDPKMDGRHVWWNIPMRNPKGGSLIGNTLDEAIDAASEPKKTGE